MSFHVFDKRWLLAKGFRTALTSKWPFASVNPLMNISDLAVVERHFAVFTIKRASSSVQISVPSQRRSKYKFLVANFARKRFFLFVLLCMLAQFEDKHKGFTANVTGVVPGVTVAFHVGSHAFYCQGFATNFTIASNSLVLI